MPLGLVMLKYCVHIQLNAMEAAGKDKGKVHKKNKLHFIPDFFKKSTINNRKSLMHAFPVA